MVEEFNVWSAGEILDLRAMLRRKAKLNEIAITLGRAIADVQRQAVILGLWGQTIPLKDHQKPKVVTRPL
jgi:hypothetical protein